MGKHFQSVPFWSHTRAPINDHHIEETSERAPMTGVRED